MDRLIDLYYDLTEYMPAEKAEVSGAAILFELKESSLDDTSHGDPVINREIFQIVCKKYDFYRKNNNKGNTERGRELYNYLLPYTQDWEYRICDS